MQTVSRKTRTIVLVIFTVYSLSFLFLHVLGKRVVSAAISPGTLTVMEVIGVALSIYGLMMPWFIQWRWPAFLVRTILEPGAPARGAAGRISPSARILLFSYVFLISPSIYGSILYDSGMPRVGLYSFAGAAVAMGLVWGLNNVRNG